MSETCIVCLGDLGENANLIGPLSPRDNTATRHDSLALARPSSPTPLDESDSSLIAHLLPCGHDLHNECLKPWVERANSCPICRQNFNQVDLSHKIGGPSVSSYAVTDRTQVADVDPSMLVDEIYEEPEDRPCPVCRDDDNEEVLLACDGCDSYYHTYCVGLDSVPMGHWFCETCETQRAIESVIPSSSDRYPVRAHNTVDRRTRAQQRRIWNRNQASSSNWARVWQSVWDHLNLDLDFPFDEDGDASRSLSHASRASQQREFREWERRLRVAEQQGGGSRFRDTASALLHNRNRRTPSRQPEPESQEEIMAWNAFEKARELESVDPPKRKRKSASTSPSEPEPSHEQSRPLKRPRTRRAMESEQSNVAESSRRSSAAGPSTSRPSAPTPTSNTGPSLLQSMLRKIEESSTPDEQTRPSPARLNLQAAGAQIATQPSSPGNSSPASSNHASPRARSITPPPSLSPRPSSPLSLTSKIEPIFPPAQFSPERSPRASNSIANEGNIEFSPEHARTSSPPRPFDASPPRASVPFQTKSDLQRMVSSALKPHYQNNVVSKDQYTDINRSVSRLLYDKVGEQGYAAEAEKETYERLAFDEVTRAVDSLKALA